jgi:hypothetical protein
MSIVSPEFRDEILRLTGVGGGVLADAQTKRAEAACESSSKKSNDHQKV